MSRREFSINSARSVRRRGPGHTLDPVALGARLRAARKELGWTLLQLAELSGVSVTTISRAERGQLALGYENFAALGQALKMDMGAMFAAAGTAATPMSGPVVTRAGQGITYRGLSFSYEFLGASVAGKQMTPNVGTLHARRISGPEDYASHAGEEFVYVLSGALEVHFASGHMVALATGDSIYFDSRIGHAYISTSKKPAKVIGAVTTESSQMRSAREIEPAEVLPGVPIKLAGRTAAGAKTRAAAAKKAASLAQARTRRITRT